MLFKRKVEAFVKLFFMEKNILDDSKGGFEFPSLDSVQEMTHLGVFAQATARRGGCLKVGSPGIEACML